MSHVRPDGDALGCIIALGLCLQQLGKDVTLWNEDGVRRNSAICPAASWSRSLRRSRRISKWRSRSIRPTRIGSGTALHRGANRAKLWINIDHHVSNEGYGDLLYRRHRAGDRADPLRAVPRAAICR